ncbi:MAG TPA: phage terminase small subunit P27 family [Streptosporangiaceae bacterium]|nr:phage terminase small subunit P27 family [Streptosporangiaceae bacterium]
MLKGETRPSQLGGGEPQPAERRPEPPGWLSGEGRAVWERTVAELEAMDLAYQADAELLGAFCSSVALLAEAEQALEAEGKMYTDPNGQKRRNPWLFVRRDAMEGVTRLAGQFGLSPSARVHLPGPAPVERPAARLLS